jgi:HSP20 family protein
MALLRFEGFDPVTSLLTVQQELDRFLRNPAFNLGPSGQGAFPPINIFDDGEGTVIVAELPGIEPAQLHIAGQGKTLSVRGERKREETGSSQGYHRRERAFGEFSRSIQLPENLDMAKATAKYENGLLTVRIPKAEAAKPRQITVQSA